MRNERLSRKSFLSPPDLDPTPPFKEKRLQTLEMSLVHVPGVRITPGATWITLMIGISKVLQSVSVNGPNKF